MDSLLTDNSATLWGYLTGLWNSHISLLHVYTHLNALKHQDLGKHRIMVAAVKLSHYKGKPPKFIYNMSAALQF